MCESYKSACERIWQERGLGFPMHIAGWLPEEIAKERNIGYWMNDGVLKKVRGKKVAKTRSRFRGPARRGLSNAGLLYYRALLYESHKSMASDQDT